MAVAFIGLGSNLGDRRANLEQAVNKLMESIRVIGLSSIYETDPVGRSEQPPFLNAVIKVETDLPAEALLGLLFSVEKDLGRQRTLRWGPRTLDLDLLVYDDVVLDRPELTLPHPEMTNRAFVLVPLAEIEPNLRLPGGQTVAEHLANLAPPWGVNQIGGWTQK